MWTERALLIDPVVVKVPGVSANAGERFHSRMPTARIPANGSGRALRIRNDCLSVLIVSSLPNRPSAPHNKTK